MRIRNAAARTVAAVLLSAAAAISVAAPARADAGADVWPSWYGSRCGAFTPEVGVPGGVTELVVGVPDCAVKGLSDVLSGVAGSLGTHGPAV